jgi:hypothetical protein
MTRDSDRVIAIERFSKLVSREPGVCEGSLVVGADGG